MIGRRIGQGASGMESIDEPGGGNLVPPAPIERALALGQWYQLIGSLSSIGGDG
jgi:hypothetical protein